MNDSTNAPSSALTFMGCACLTRERIAERETEIRLLPWMQTEKHNALAKCRLGLRAWRTKKPTLCLHAVTDEDGHPLENEDESGRRPSEYWGKIFDARVEGERHHCQETILRHVRTAPWPHKRNLFLAHTLPTVEKALMLKSPPMKSTLCCFMYPCSR